MLVALGGIVGRGGSLLRPAVFRRCLAEARTEDRVERFEVGKAVGQRALKAQLFLGALPLGAQHERRQMRAEQHERTLVLPSAFGAAGELQGVHIAVGCI